MKAAATIVHRFVEYIPAELEERTLYVSIPYASATHLCPCGCGLEVVTPLSPTDWRLTFDGDTVSLDPSIGNWSLPCQSHYWIRRNRVLWADRWTAEEIKAGRRDDQAAKLKYYGENVAVNEGKQPRHVPSDLHTRAINWIRRRLR